MKYTEKDLKQLRESFDWFDKDKNGHITVSEMQEAMEKLGSKLTTKEIENIMSEVDLDKNGTIEFDEFCNLMKHTDFAKLSDLEMRNLFNQFDKDKNGTIDPSELKAVMIEMGHKVTDQDIKNMIEAADLDKNGVIDFEEFKKMMQG